MEFPLQKIKRDAFPPLLRTIPDAPSHLFMRGTLPCTSATLTVVGARSFTPYGKYATEKFIGELSSYDITIASGLALGIDSLAHTAALHNALPTIAVLPSGVDDASVYPRTHAPLAQKILKTGGALLSEYDVGTSAAPFHFPARNRILAGIAGATLIIECKKKSGTLITARLAMEYNRDVLAVPHALNSPTKEGPLHLISEGAYCIQHGREIAEVLGIKSKKREKQETKYTKEEWVLLSILETPHTRDELMEISSLGGTAFNVALSSLELKNAIEETLGMIRKRED